VQEMPIRARKRLVRHVVGKFFVTSIYRGASHIYFIVAASLLLFLPWRNGEFSDASAGRCRRAGCVWFRVLLCRVGTLTFTILLLKKERRCCGEWFADTFLPCLQCKCSRDDSKVHFEYVLLLRPTLLVLEIEGQYTETSCQILRWCSFPPKCKF